MVLRLLAVLVIVGLYLLVPAISLAATSQVIVITASPLIGNECVSNFDISVTMPVGGLGYYMHLTWTPAPAGNGTRVLYNVGEYPADCEDGIIYEGNDTSTIHVVIDSDDLVAGLYYRVYSLIDGNCSSCYATGSVIASVTEGTTPTGNVTLDTSGLDDMADLMRVGLILGFPILFGLIGVLRASLTGYVIGVVGLCLATTYIWDGVGTMLGIPMLLVIFGLLMSAMRNALSEGLRIF
jgi:hypothetical protein